MKHKDLLTPAKKPAPLTTYAFRMSAKHRETFDLLGGAHWLRAVLDKAAKELSK